MSGRLDQLVAGLASTPPDRSLDALEGEIALRLTRRRTEARLGTLAPLAAVSVSVAMALGLAVGGMTAAAAPARHVSAFAIEPELAPSTLLGDER
jgi:hypothetical protein